MPGRKYSAGSLYRYGFNGKENDNEVKGEGNQQDYGMRVYDPRLGRFLSVDPVTRTYPWYTPYQFAGNMPIVAIDLDGAEPKDGTIVTGGWGGQLTVRRASDQEIKEYQKGMGTAGVIGAAVATDIFITKGWLTRTLIFSQGLGTLYHQPAKTPEQAKERGREVLEFGKTWALGFTAGKVLGGILKLGPSQEEVKYLFRGTSEGYEGSKATQALSQTPTSSDPVVATIFAINAKNYGKGILQIALPNEFKAASFSSNVLAAAEKEIAVGVKPAEFTKNVTLTLTADESTKILSDMGIKLQPRIPLFNLSYTIENTPRLTSDQIKQFYEKALELKSNVKK